MTTILADVRFGVMVCDSMASDGERRSHIRKVWRPRRDLLVGLAGTVCDFDPFIAWCRQGMHGTPPRSTELFALLLTPDSLTYFTTADKYPTRLRDGREAIGSGGMAAMAAYEAMGFEDPQRAVRIASKHDAASGGPIRVYRVK